MKPKVAPSSPITVVFDAYHLYHLPQFDPVIDLLHADDRFNVYLSTSADNIEEEQELTTEILRKRSDQVITAGTELERAKKIRQLSPDVLICGWSRHELQDFVTERTLTAMAYHGIGVKPSYWLDNHPRLDLRFVEGPFRERQLRENGITTDLALTGFAKLDPLFNGLLEDRESLLERLRLDPHKKTILYAPTFYPSSVEPFGLGLARDTTEYNLIIKLHMWAYFNVKFPVNLRPQRLLAEEMEKRFDHVRVMTPGFYNIVPLYRVADVLLTEASSTIYEMMALDKPVIVCQFYRLRMSHLLFRRRLYKRRLDAEMSEGMTDFCIKLQKPSDLKEALHQALTVVDAHHERRQAYKEEMLYRLDGRASERIRDAILQRLAHR